MSRTRNSHMRTAMDLIAARLQHDAAFVGISVIVYAQQEIESKIKAAIAKTGNCVLIYPSRLPKGNPERKGKSYSLSMRVEISSNPVLIKPDQALADELLEAAISCLDGYNIEPYSHVSNRVVCGDAEPVTDPSYLVWAIDVHIQRLTIPLPNLTP